ncbi:hypothetical protein, partial [Pseudoalteromonas rubra]
SADEETLLEDDLTDDALAEEDFPAFEEEDALAALDDEPHAAEAETGEAPEQAASAEEETLLEDDLTDDALAEEDFPAFEEEDALAALDDEPQAAEP